MDALLARLAYTPGPQQLTPIPWPAGLAPTPINYNSAPDSTLPKADAIVCAFTTAEGMALADVLSPGHKLTDWLRYTKDWASYQGQLTGRSPAREENCLGSYALTQIGTKRVLLYKHSLHPDTDKVSLPVAQLWQQIIGEVQPSLVVTHGTAGGIGAETVLGDVLVATNVRWNCQGQFKNAPFAHQSYACSEMPVTMFAEATSLMTVNAPKLRPVATRDPIIVLQGDVETTDFFAFDDAENHYGLRTFDSNAHMVEMDDAACGLAIQRIGAGAPPWVSVRNASDPQIPKGISLEAEDKSAGAIYDRYGYYTTVNSSIACWALVAAL